MSAPASPLPELEDVVRHGSAERRAHTLQRITALFLANASQFSDEHVALFDTVFLRLIDEIETKARAELSLRLAPVRNAPAGAVRRLAKDDDIAVAGPLLQQSERLRDSDLVEIARTKGQAHLLAIAGRSGIAEAVTDVLVRRGDRQVVRGVADNRQARLSEQGFATLVNRAESDGILAEKVGSRPDIPPRLFRELLLKATEVVRGRLLASAPPETRADVRRVLAKVSEEVAKTRDYSAAEQAVEALQQADGLNEAALLAFARSGKQAEVVVSLARLCAVPIEVVERLIAGDRPDPVLILCKAAGWEWPTVKTLITSRAVGKATPSHALDTAFANFERLSPATAQRVIRFWQARPDGGGAA